MTAARELWRREQITFVGAFGAAAVLLGFATAIVSSSPKLVLALVLSVAALPVLVAAVRHIAGGTGIEAVALLGLGGLNALVIHHNPDITLLELILLGPSVFLVLAVLPRTVVRGRGTSFVRLFAVCSAGLVALGALQVVFPATSFDLGAPIRELAKNLEIFMIVGGVFAYVTSIERLARVYALLVVNALVSILVSLAETRGHIFAEQSLQNGTPLFVLILALPFVRTRSVRAVATGSFILLLLARTRGAWFGLVVVMIVLLVSRSSRRSIGRGGVVAVIAATVVMVGAIAFVPALLARAGSLASGSDQSLQTRVAMARAALIELRDHPLTGVGPGEFKPWLLNSPPVVDFRIGVTQIPRDPHDAFAKFAGEMGLPGLLLFVGWVVSVISPVWLFRRFDDWWTDVRPYAVGMRLYAVILVLTLFTTEWAALGRLQIALNAGMLLGLVRIVSGRTSEREVAA